MQICRLLAGYSYARADLVRRAMSKKKTSAMQAERDDFISGCAAHGVNRADAEEIFEEMVGFAKYAFNKSHATAYGIISYRTAYLKAHYPAEYFASLLTSVLDSQTKVREYIADAARFGVSVLPPDINESRQNFASTGGAIRFGLLAIKNVGRNFSDAVIRERAKHPFVSFDEFVSRMINTDINKRTLESMIKCGVFDSLGVTRSALLLSYENIIDSEHDRQRNNVSGQLDLFSIGSQDSGVGGYAYPIVPEYSLRELLLLERESSGMYFSGHMIDSYSSHVDELKPDMISDILDELSENDGEPTGTKYKDKSTVRLAGIIISKKTKITKSGDAMAFITLEDRYAAIEVIVFARQYKQFSELLNEEGAVTVVGNISTEEGEEPRVLLSSAEPLIGNSDYAYSKSRASRAAEIPQQGAQKPKTIYIKVERMSDGIINTVMRISALNRGDAEVAIFDASCGKYLKMKNVTVAPSEKVIDRLKSIFSPENVVLR